MISCYKIIISTLQSELFSCEYTDNHIVCTSSKEWHQLFQLSAQQGVMAIVYDAVMKLPAEYQPPRAIKLQWALNADNVVKRHTRQFNAAYILSEKLASKNIQTLVLKGFSIGTYYPTPEHRECGDMDCFLIKENGDSGYELGNQICEQLGAKVERDYYKHSHINFKGLAVENHAFCTAIRGDKKRKEFERHLQKLLKSRPSTPINNSNLLRPCADFNALFLTAHGLGHFLTEGIKLRHILDWALLLKAEQNNIDWAEFYYWSDKMNMTRFANALTAISVKYLGLEITNPAIQTTSKYAELILKDTLYHSEGIHNKGYSAWIGRIKLIQNKFSFIWKYHKIYQKSMLWDLIKSAGAFLFERNPKL